MSAKRICIIYMYVLSNSSIPVLVIWPIQVGDLANTGWRFGQYWLAIWPIPAGDLANTGWRFRQYRRRYIFQDLGRFVIEIGDSKNMGGLRIIPRYGIKSKKRSIRLQKCPIKYNVVDEPHSINVDMVDIIVIVID